MPKVFSPNRAAVVLIALLLWPALKTVAVTQLLPVPDNLWRLVAQEDTDGDRKITVHDHVTPFALKDENGATSLTVSNVYPLSVLLQKLKRADDAHHRNRARNRLRLDENIVDRTHRLIRDVYWDALTRRIDAAHVDQVDRTGW